MQRVQPPRAEQGFRRAERPGGQSLRLFDHVPAVEETTGFGQLGQVERQPLQRAEQSGPAFVTGGVKGSAPLGGVRPEGVRQRRAGVIHIPGGRMR